MSDNFEHRQLMDGIKGIHDRLDILNGRVYKHEQYKADRADLKVLENKIDGNKALLEKRIEINQLLIYKIFVIIAALIGGAEIIKGLL